MTNRRDFLKASGLASAGLAALNLLEAADPAQKAITLRIAPVSLDIGPAKTIKTIGYNGSVPGPILRFKEGKPVTVDVFNDTDVAETVHWHGQQIPSAVDGSVEELTPAVPAHGHRRYRFTPEPAGTRWYHTHSMAHADLSRAGFSGQFGFAIVEPAHEPGNYDQEICLAAHHWEPSLANMGPPDNGWEIAYRSATLNGKILGAGEPIRVREGQRVLFRLLNASATDEIRLALPGHRFNVIALDGNPVPHPQTVDVLYLDIAERIDAIVEMNNPGVWVLASTKDDERMMGMGVVVEYANRNGQPQWQQPANVGRGPWDYSQFGNATPAPEPDHTFEMKFQKIPGNRKDFNHWTINGKSWPDLEKLRLEKGRRYRLSFNNDSGDIHPLHLHRHTFEITNAGGKSMSGVMKDVISVNRRTTAAIDFVANNPGLTLFHCHMQLHMDFGFMQLLEYAG
ncbi:MAG TPA: multicopper oxidase domain-containing protein [Bryobacteraceae bacterium]|nr:multicopper oxidase domain-containing protein [Bryobacteraceae bacterium]